MGLDNERSRVAHLLRRAGFGGSEAEVDEYAALGFEGSVDRLLNPERVEDDLDQKVAALKPDMSKVADVQLVWLYRMVNTRRPLPNEGTTRSCWLTPTSRRPRPSGSRSGRSMASRWSRRRRSGH